MAGGVIWITGLPASGKSTLAQAVLGRLRAEGVQSLLLDGDALRASLWPEAGYDAATRRALGLAYARLAVALAEQGSVVVVAAVALFHCVHDALRAQAPRYVEVWLRTEEGARAERIAAPGGRGPEVGVEVAAEFPRRPEWLVDNDYTPRRLEDIAQRICEAWCRDDA